jgi:NADH-quinone oxidoreductase subunit I
MYGLGLLKGLGLTLKHFFDTYTEDLRWLGSKYTTPTFGVRQGAQARGIFTVEYPDEKLAVPERFRFVPFLVVNNYDDPYAPGDDWCTSCGICAKVCPPQCIWIVRGTDPETGRPKPQPEAFYIDIDICMNCGYCAEYCPFDAIKMDHDYELASYDRTTHHIYDKKKLSKEYRYWQMLAPTRVREEAERRGHWEHKDVEKLAKKAGVTLPEPTEANMHRATTVLPEDHQKAAAPAARPVAAAGAPALVATTTVTRSGDARADVKNESLPMPLRAQAAIQARDESSGEGKKYSLVPEERKAISAVQKFAKDQGLTLEELAAKSVDAMPAAPAAPAAAAPVAQAAAPVAAAPAGVRLGGDIWEAKQLELKGKNKEIRLTGDDRKHIAQAKKAVQEAGLDWEAITEASVSGLAGAAPVAQAAAPVVEAVAAAAPVAVAPAPAAGGEDAELKAAKDLERRGSAKEIRLTGEDRKRIAAAKKAAKDAGIDWDSL